MRRRLYDGNFRRQDFNAPELLGTRSKKKISKLFFFQKKVFFQNCFSRKGSFFQRKNFFSKKKESFFKIKVFISNYSFFHRKVF